MALKTTMSQLEDIQTAIAALAAGAQSVSIDGISYSQSSIDSLEKREETLFRRLNQPNIRKRTTPDMT